MSRSNLKLFIPLCIGLLFVLVLLFALLRMVQAERSDAIWAAERHQRLVVQYAHGELSAQLQNRLARAHTVMRTAQADPLVACPGCVLRQSGRQVLPLLAPGGARGNSVQFWYEALDAGRDEGDAMWAERIALQALCSGPEGVARVAAFRASYALLIEQELASALALAEKCALSASARTAVLRGTAGVPGQRSVEGVQQMFLRRARALSPDDAEYVYQRIVRASERAGVSHREFSLRYRELAAEEVAIPEGRSQPSLVAHGDAHYYVQPAGQEQIGVWVDLSAELGQVAETMRQGRLIDAGDELEARVPAGGQALAALAIGLRSPRAARARRDIHDRYRSKLLLLGLCGLLALVIAGMGVLLQRRRMRILELKSHFVAGVSHELKTPLASMRVLAETLDRRTQGMAEVRDYPQRLLRDIDGMVFLVENILSFNRLTKGRMAAKRQVTSIGELVVRAVDDVREHSGKRIEVEFEPENTNITGDPELLFLLFRNLVANSVAYNHHKIVTIFVHTRVLPQQRIEVSVRDNGVGISDADRQDIFDDFYRGETASMARGSGLGLALCKRIVELHEGTIGVGETGPDGTLFRMVFP